MSGRDNGVIKLAFSRVILVKILQILRLTFSPGPRSNLYTVQAGLAVPRPTPGQTLLYHGLEEEGGGGAINKQTNWLSGYITNQPAR